MNVAWDVTCKKAIRITTMIFYVASVLHRGIFHVHPMYMG